MQLDLNRLVDGRLRTTFEVAPGSPVLAGYPAEVREPFVVDVELTNPTHGTYVMTADVHGRVMEPCRRCLIPVEVAVEDRYRVVYQHRGPRQGEDTGDEDIVTIDPGANVIEIDREVRDRLFVETEQYALCMEECRGICPNCGANLNLTTCDCVVENGDPRWQALESLRRLGGE
jgi:uncharacterized protein